MEKLTMVTATTVLGPCLVQAIDRNLWQLELPEKEEDFEVSLALQVRQRQYYRCSQVSIRGKSTTMGSLEA